MIRVSVVIMILFLVSRVYCQEPAPNPSGDSDKDWMSSVEYNIYGETIGKGVSYYNEGGKPVEGQIWDITTQKVWATRTFYDQYNRPALSTFPAPQNVFGVNGNFIRDELGGYYDLMDYDDLSSTVGAPSPVGTMSLLGQYYSSQNPEPYQDVTD